MRHTLNTLAGLGLAVVLSQFPEYAQQYTQRLGGAVDELRVITEEFDRSAAAAGLSRDAALNRFSAAGDTFIEDRGRSMGQTIARYDMLRLSLTRIRGASGWERVANLPRYLDTDIGSRTLEAFQPAVPVTVEGLAWAGGGFGLGYLLMSALGRLVSLPFRRRRPPREPA